MNRAALFQAIEPLIEPSPSQRETIRKSLDKVLLETVQALPLEAAQALPTHIRAELEIVLRDLCSSRELGKVAALWEPQRKLDAHLKQSLRRDLIDLLQGCRQRFDGLKIVSLTEARGAGPAYRDFIVRVMPTRDASKLLRTWDKHIQPVPSSRDQIADRLLALLSGATPMEKAKKASVRRAA